MDTIRNVLRRFQGQSIVRDTRGLGTVEYVILLVLIAGVAIGSWVTFGGKVKSKLERANTEYDKVNIEGQGPSQ